jgi:hypothetical protein
VLALYLCKWHCVYRKGLKGEGWKRGRKGVDWEEGIEERIEWRRKGKGLK